MNTNRNTNPVSSITPITTTSTSTLQNTKTTTISTTPTPTSTPPVNNTNTLTNNDTPVTSTSTSSSTSTSANRTKLFVPYNKLTPTNKITTPTPTTSAQAQTSTSTPATQVISAKPATSAPVPAPIPLPPTSSVSKLTIPHVSSSSSSSNSKANTLPNAPSAPISKVTGNTTAQAKQPIYTNTTNNQVNTTTKTPTTTTTTTTSDPSLKRPPPPAQEIEDKKVIKKKRLVGPLTIAEEDFIANAFKSVPDSKLSTDVKRIKRKFLLREFKRGINLETFDLDVKVQQYASHMKKKDQKVSLYFSKEEIPAVFTKKPLHSLENLNGVIDEKVNELAHPLQVFSTQLQHVQQQQLEKQLLEQERKLQLERQQELERQQQLEKWRRELKDTTINNEDGIHSMIVHAEYLLNDKKPMKPIPPPCPPAPQPQQTQQEATAHAAGDGTDNDLKKHYHWTNTNSNNNHMINSMQHQSQQHRIIKPFQILKEKILYPKRNLEQLIQPYISPHTTRELKSFIRRDYETVPRCVSMLRELYQFFIANGMVEYSPLATEFYPIDYRYLTPELVDKTQWFLCEEFWPGIDLNEILEYPDFTVVAMYRSMVVGCGMMNPDGYIMYLAVRPGWNGNGIASFMLYHLTQTMIGRDITLHVSTNNTAMILYQKFGFKIEEYIVGFYDKFYSNESGRSKNAYLLRLRR